MEANLKTFAYTARDRYKKRVKGELKSKSLFEAKAELRGRKYLQIVVHEVRVKAKKQGWRKIGHGYSNYLGAVWQNLKQRVADLHQKANHHDALWFAHS
jgi:type II secretory pathway component PulF